MPFLKKMAKTLFLAYLGPFLKFFGQNDENYVENKKIRLVIFFGLRCPLLPAKFQKNCLSGFQETVPDGQTEVIL